ncbi:MAG: cupin domain-containing protein [Bacteroidota bacterium]
MASVNLNATLDHVVEYFFPRVIASVNDHYVKVVKIKGDDVPWHNHEDSDELFYVLKGNLDMKVRGQPPVALTEGDVFVVPKGAYHRISAAEECHIMLIERKDTLHTGTEISAITKSIREQL